MNKTPIESQRFYSQENRQSDWVWTALIAFLALALFRPYLGITHDARLYIGFALAELDPSGIGTDIMFQHDGQSKFSVFPSALTQLVRWLGPGRAALSATYLGLALWALAISELLRVILSECNQGRYRLPMVFVIVALPAFYGGSSIFQFAEQFVTPRVYAEAAMMAGIAFALQKRWIRCAAFSACALAVHPIMAAPGIALAIWTSLKKNRSKLIVAGVVLVGAALLALGTRLGWQPSFLFAKFDPEWRSALDRKNALVFVSHWKVEGWARMVVHASTLLVARHYVPVGLKRLIDGALLLGIVSIILAFILGDLISNVLVTQIQPWRALWVVSLLSVIFFAFVWVRSLRPVRDPLSKPEELRQCGILLLALSWITVELYANAAVLSALGLFVWYLPRLMPTLVLPRRGYLTLSTTLVAIAVATVAAKGIAIYGSLVTAPDPSVWRRWFYHLAVGAPTLLVLSAVVLRGKGLDVSSTLQVNRQSWGLIALLTAAIGTWDSRTQYQKSVEVALANRIAGRTPPIVLPRGSSVFWLGGDLEAWAFVGRAGWGTVLQGISGVFNRELSMLWDSRWELLASSGLPMFEGQIGSIQTAGRIVVNDEMVRAICSDVESPTAIVLPQIRQSGTIGKTLQLGTHPVLPPSDGDSKWRIVKEFDLIACSDSIVE